MSSGADIAAEVAAGLADAGSDTGTGPLVCTLRRPADRSDLTPAEAEAFGDEAPTYFDITAVQTKRHIRDEAGTLTGRTMTVLLVSAIGETPRKSDFVAIGVASANIVDTTPFNEVSDVHTTAPGGVAVLHEVMLAD